MSIFIKNDNTANFQVRKWFIPSSITNFNKDVQCPATSTKFGAICFDK